MTIAERHVIECAMTSRTHQVHYEHVVFEHRGERFGTLALDVIVTESNLFTDCVLLSV